MFFKVYKYVYVKKIDSVILIEASKNGTNTQAYKSSKKVQESVNKKANELSAETKALKQQL